MKILAVACSLAVLFEVAGRVIGSNLRTTHVSSTRNPLLEEYSRRGLLDSSDSLKQFVGTAVLQVPDLQASQDTWLGPFSLNVTDFRCGAFGYHDVNINLISGGDSFQLEVVDLLFKCDFFMAWSYRNMKGAGTVNVISGQNYLSSKLPITNRTDQGGDETCEETQINIEELEFTGDTSMRVMNLFSLFIREVAEAKLEDVFCDLMSQEMLGLALGGAEKAILKLSQDVPGWRSDPLFKENSSGNMSIISLQNDHQMSGVMGLAIGMLNNLLATKKYDPTTPTSDKMDYGINTALREKALQNRTLVNNKPCSTLSRSEKLVDIEANRSSLKVSGLDTADVVTPFTAIGRSTLQSRLKWDSLTIEMDVTTKLSASTRNGSIFENADEMEPIAESFQYRQTFTGLELLVSFYIPLERSQVEALPVAYFNDWGSLPPCFPPVLFGMEVSGLDLSIDGMQAPVLLGIESSDIDEVLAKAIQIAMAAFEDDILLMLPALVQVEGRDILDELIKKNHCTVARRLLEGEGEGEEEEFVPPAGKELYINMLCAFGCVCTAAMAAGLTMGLLSLDELMLLIKQRAGATEKERNAAARLLPIVRQHHLLLVSLLLMNAMANEALPLFLDKIVPGYVAVILSVTLVLFFGEIIPSALFTGPNQVNLASNLAPLVNAVLIILSPIAWPIAKVLDYLLHEHDDGGYNKKELSALVRIQYESHLASKRQRKTRISSALKQYESLDSIDSYASRRESGKSIAPEIRQTLRAMKKQFSQRHMPSSDDLHVDEVTMVEGALQMGTTEAIDVYTPWDRVFAVPKDMILTERCQVRIYRSGHSRIPVYEKNKDDPEDKTRIIGILVAKQLMVVDSQDNREISTLPLAIPRCVSPRETLVDLVNLFQRGGVGGSHMALVCSRPEDAAAALKEGHAIPEEANLLGVVTLEDVLESLIQEQIYDEFDRKEKERLRLARWGFQRWRRFVRKHKKSRGETTPGDSILIKEPRMLDVVDEAMAQYQEKDPPTEKTSLLGRLNPFS